MKRILLLSVLIAALITLVPVGARANTNQLTSTTTKKSGEVIALRKSVFKWNNEPDDMKVENSKVQKTFANFIGYLVEDNISLSGKFKNCKIRRQVTSLIGGERKVIADETETPIADKATQGIMLGGWVTGEPLSDGILDKNEVLIELIQPDGTRVALWHYEITVQVKDKQITKTETAL